MSQSTDYLRHILDETKYLMASSKGISKSRFLKNQTVKRAFVRSIEIIGEAAKKVSPEFKERYSDIDWKAMAGMRDRLIHDYLGIDYDLVWDVVINKIPSLKKRVEEILQSEES